jgi:hypothetical protein
MVAGERLPCCGNPHRHDCGDKFNAEARGGDFAASQRRSQWPAVGTEMIGHLIYQIRIKGHLDEAWMNWFSPLVVVNGAKGEATLTGAVRDQAELAGVLNRIFDLNLTLLAVNVIMDPSE